MRELCEIIKETVKPNFLNIRTSIRTYDRDAVLYGAPCWRWVYHALHSADKWFINPFDYAEPDFHTEGLDDPEKPCGRVLSDRELLDYLDRIEQKTYDYLDSLTDEDLKEVLHTAMADFVLDLPDGLDTECGERGSGLSEGQAQRIAIARGLLRPGGILLLDEISASLDEATERELYRRLFAKYPRKTMIFITHRPVVCELCDQVIKLRS